MKLHFESFSDTAQLLLLHVVVSSFALYGLFWRLGDVTAEQISYSVGWFASAMLLVCVAVDHVIHRSGATGNGD